MNNQYDVIFEIYDEFSGIDVSQWAKYIRTLIKKHSTIPTQLVLDAACGTGRLTAELAEDFDMIGLDVSCGMLSVARQKCPPQVLLLNQDMRQFDLYGTVSAVICCLDSVNYLNSNDIEKFFACCHLFLDPDGLLIFDVNTKYKFENVYKNNDFIFETDDGARLLAWGCDYDTEKKQCTFSLSLFSENEDGTYTRDDEQQYEYMHTDEDLRRALENCGFEILGIYGELSYDIPSEDSQRHHFVCKNIKS